MGNVIVFFYNGTISANVAYGSLLPLTYVLSIAVILHLEKMKGKFLNINISICYINSYTLGAKLLFYFTEFHHAHC